jgi:hypothetical protein
MKGCLLVNSKGCEFCKVKVLFHGRASQFKSLGSSLKQNARASKDYGELEHLRCANWLSTWFLCLEQAERYPSPQGNPLRPSQTVMHADLTHNRMERLEFGILRNLNRA